jgi:hypothetical protein
VSHQYAVAMTSFHYCYYYYYCVALASISLFHAPDHLFCGRRLHSLQFLFDFKHQLSTVKLLCAVDVACKQYRYADRRVDARVQYSPSHFNLSKNLSGTGLCLVDLQELSTC